MAMVKAPERSGFRYRAAACAGKQRFDDLALARRAAKRKRGRHAYKCKACRGWHVGVARKAGRPWKPNRVKRMLAGI